MAAETEMKHLVALIEHQNELLRILAQPIAQEAARSKLDGSDERQVYALTDGTRSSRQMEAETGVSKSSVARWWRDWRTAGLIVEPPKGNARTVFSLEELDLPPIPTNSKTPPKRRKPKA